MIGIYKITNNINNKVYIGQAVDIEKRWNMHKWNAIKCNSNYSENQLNRAFKKYKLENFSFSILKECCQEDLNCLEQFFIRAYYSYDKLYGYNLTLGGNTSFEYKQTDMSKKYKSDLKSICNKGRYWWTNGVNNKFQRNQPDGFTKGRTLKISDKAKTNMSRKLKELKKDCRWWTNGSDYIFNKNCPVGYIAGGKQKPGTSEKLKGRKWWTNGAVQVYEFLCPNGFYAGVCRKTVKGYKSWNNGFIEKRSIICPGDDFIEGKLAKIKKK